MNTSRTHELAFGVRTHKPPEDMSRIELEDALYDIAAFASQRLSESITLRKIIENRITK